MKYIFTLIFPFISLLCLAQQKPIAKVKAQNIYYLKKDGYTEAGSKELAEIIRVVSEGDDGEKLYDVKEFNRDSSLRMIGKSLDVNPVKLQGQAVYYYHDGTKKRVVNYVVGRRDGDCYEYYPNGKMHIILKYLVRDSVIRQNYKIFYSDSLFLNEYDKKGKALIDNGNGHYIITAQDNKNFEVEGEVKNSHASGEWFGRDYNYGLQFKEIYDNGRLIKGESTDSLGNSYIYTVRHKVAGQIKDGKDFVFGFIGNHIRYPYEAQEKHIQGKVTIGLTIAANGTASNYTFMENVSPEIDAHALSVIKSVKKWQPAEAYGKPVASQYIFPVSFLLR